MKCDNCKFLGGEPASMDYPYPITYCRKGHWDGADPSDRDVFPDPWKDCRDYKAEPEIFEGTRDALANLTSVQGEQK